MCAAGPLIPHRASRDGRRCRARRVCRRRSPRRAAGTGSRCTRRSGTPAGRCGSPPSVPNRAELGDMIRNQLTECRRLGVTIDYGVGVWPGLVDEQQPDHVIVATGAEPQRPWWVPGDADHVVDVRDVLDGTRQPVRRRRRDRRDRLPPRHVGRRAARRSRLQRRDRHQRHGRRPGPRHHARHGELVDARRREGHRAVDRPRADGHGRRTDRRRLNLLHHPTGATSHARPTGSCWPCRRPRSSGCTTT